MKRAQLLTVCLMMIAGMAFAQAGSIGVFADGQGLNCNLDNTVGFLQIYCVHVSTTGATACQFRVEIVGAPLTYIGETPPYMAIGNSRTGVAIPYGACLVSPIHMLTITYMGVSDPCDMVRVVEDITVTPPGIYVADCTLPTPNILVATGGSAYINNDGSCPCDIPSEDTTWGRIKSIYQ